MLIAATIDTPVGKLAAAFSTAGLVRIAFAGELISPATELLGRWHPGEEIIEKDSAGRELRKQLGEYFAGERRGFEVDLDVRGTPFRRKVWEALRRIPYGRTVTYGALARSLESSARAVGAACGANPISIIIPCHRVIAADGNLRGYGGGLAAKRLLLELEGARDAGQQALFG